MCGESRSPASSTASRSTLTVDYAGDIWDLFSAYTVFAGLAVVSLFAFHGATFLSLRMEGELRTRIEGVARRLAVPAAPLGAVYPRLDSRGRDGSQRQGSLSAGATGRARRRCPGARCVFVLTGRYGKGFVLTACGVVALVCDALYEPLPARDGVEPGLRKQSHRRRRGVPHYALTVMSVAALILVPLVLLYQGWTYYVFRRRLGGESTVSS